MLRDYFPKINNSGLTLLETTIALGILMLGIMASLTLMLSSFNFSRQSEDEIIVVNLAREGIEIMRSLRNNESSLENDDFNIFDLDNNGEIDSGDSYFAFDNQVTNDINDWANYERIITNATAAASCADCTLYLKNGQYTHDSSGGAEATDYKRLIKIIPLSLTEKRIVSEVSWQVKNKTLTFTLEAEFFDWQ